MPTEDEMKTAHRRSLGNRPSIMKGGYCGCFKCLRVYPGSEVVTWTGDDTAVCPYCQIDSVLSVNDSPITPDFLRAMYERYFKNPVQLKV